MRHTDDSSELTVEPYRVVVGVGARAVEPTALREGRSVDGETLARAGESGYETHLAVIHWTLGNSAGWRQWLAENPPEGGHPQNIWAVDLNRNKGTKTKPREPAERIYP